MKKLECFQCELCNEIYAQQDECLSCEKSHVDMTKLKIVEVKHVFDSSRWGFPYKLRLVISDYSGCMAEYRKIEEGSVEDFEPFIKAIDDL